MKYFISQPMKGKTEEEILAKREEIISIIKTKDADAEIIDSYNTDYQPCEGNRALKFLSMSLSKLAEADVLVSAKGYENARGCKIEHDCALAYGLEVIEL